MSSTPRSARGKQSIEHTVLILRIARSKLVKFPHEKKPTKAGGSKVSSTPSTPIADAKESPTAAPSLEVKDETPNENPDDSQANGSKKGNGGPKPALKRGNSSVPDALAKSRARPGPKRRKVGDTGLTGEEAGKPWTQSAPTGGHKLGPKANQGAINAGLRALDRSGKPCRKWTKGEFSVKSFTGLVWTLPTWSAPKKESDSKEESGDATTPNANGEQQATSPAGNGEGDLVQANGTELNGLESSPAPIAAAS